MNSSDLPGAMSALSGMTSAATRKNYSLVHAQQEKLRYMALWQCVLRLSPSYRDPNCAVLSAEDHRARNNGLRLDEQEYVRSAEGARHVAEGVAGGTSFAFSLFVGAFFSHPPPKT